MTLADELIAWVEQYAKKVCPDGCLPTPGQEREINLFARITRVLQGSDPAQASPERIAELQYEAGMYQSLYENAVETCATMALEQRCERGTPWDLACTTIAEKIRGLAVPSAEGNSHD